MPYRLIYTGLVNWKPKLDIHVSWYFYMFSLNHDTHVVSYCLGFVQFLAVRRELCMLCTVIQSNLLSLFREWMLKIYSSCQLTQVTLWRHIAEIESAIYHVSRPYATLLHLTNLPAIWTHLIGPGLCTDVLILCRASSSLFIPHQIC